MDTQNSSNRALNIIIDGYGFDPEVERRILNEMLKHLNPAIIAEAQAVLEDASEGDSELDALSKADKARIVLSPTPVTLFPELMYDKNRAWKVTMAREELMGDHEDAITHMLQSKARAHKYAIWAAHSPALFQNRNYYPTAITRTSGPEAGYEDISPRVQGNSDTGHQQLGNLAVAPQLPLEISMSIKEGRFFENPALTETIEAAVNAGGRVNATILLSGNQGNNGRVHSCWNHLEAFLKLCFDKYSLKPDQVRLFAILDGRDSAPDSSLRQEDGKGFLPMLKSLLAQYNAEQSLAWILGRSYAMDRDYDESKTARAYSLLVEGSGTEVESFDAAIVEVQRQQDSDDRSDTTVLPIVIKYDGEVRTIASNDAFIDLNFRADRQRQIIAALLNAREFIANQTKSKKQGWRFDWIRDDLKLHVCCMAEYHPDFEQKYGARVAFANAAHTHNFINLLCEQAKEENSDFNYLLLAESTKALHVGYFIRGRREALPGSVFEPYESRRIVNSYGKEKGVQVDDDFYKTPQMKAYEIAGILANELANEDLDFAVVNFSNPDMIGHLITRHFDAVVKAIEVMDRIVDFIVPLALDHGYHVILTADHGNADSYSPAHGSHDVLTTVCAPEDDLAIDLTEETPCARLFDIPWVMLEVLGKADAIAGRMPALSEWVRSNGLAGRSFVKRI